mmetsp:Transcript_31100/g.56784  ORF Transcript_31100/g.56784 Transcript_31100/m.56784 type:complete len:794 (+) Transcript_31100:2-2383(+)
MDGRKKDQFPPVTDGDVVKVRVSKGSNVSLCKGSKDYINFRVRGDGRFRIGVTFTSKGQKAEILDEDQPATPVETGGMVMKAGNHIEMPSKRDPRLSSMRTRYSEEAMSSHCGRTAKVVKVAERCVRMSVHGKEFWWDIELFPQKVGRCCHHGCTLQACVKTHSRCTCDVCHSRLPEGSSTLYCEAHDYDICAYCQGQHEVPPPGSKVIRGPTWTWKDQDGLPHTEGVCEGPPDRDGWIPVRWPSGTSSKYRADNFYQDVWLARENGLQGVMPYQEEDKKSAGTSDLKKLLELIRPGEGSDPRVSLPYQSWTPDTGFTFVENGVPEVTVGSSKKDATCIRENPSYWASIVTEQVILATYDEAVVFQVLIKALPLGAKGLFAWGICTPEAAGFQRNVPGVSGFKGSMGCVVTPDGAHAVHEDKIVSRLPSVQEGDTVGVRIQQQRCEWLHQGRVVHTTTTKGKFRFVVTLGIPGQHVVIQGGVSAEAGSTKVDIAKLLPHVDLGTGPSDLRKHEELGRGAFGVVFRASMCGDDVVVKEVLAEALTEEVRKNFVQEVQALAFLRHENLVMIKAINAQKHLIVCELCTLGDLKCYLGKAPGSNASADDRRGLMHGVAKGMAWVAGHGMVHRDLKPANVLVSNPKSPIAKVGDFGLVMPLKKCQTEGGIQGTLVYMAPEVFLGEVSEKSDVYAFSLVLAYAFGMGEWDVSALTNMEAARVMAMMGDRQMVNRVIVQAIRNGRRPEIPSFVPPEIQGLVKESWDEKPANRPHFVALCESLTQPIACPNFTAELARASR